MTPPRQVATTVIAGAMAICVGAYVIARAIAVPLTYDEASAFYRYVAADAAALFDFATAANHLLQSILTRVSASLLGSAPWALRLPAVLAGLAYIVVAGALARRLRHRHLGAAAFVLLVTNPYLLDYLALARGYALAVALFSGSTYLMLRWLDRPPASARRELTLSLGLAGCAVVANYATLAGFLSMVAIAVVRLACVTRRTPAIAGTAIRGRWWRPRQIVAWALLTLTFNVLVFGRERVISFDTFGPVTLRIAGLFDDELADVHVFRADVTGRLREIRRGAAGVWTLGRAHHAWDEMRVALPRWADLNLATLDVTVGEVVYRRDRRTPGPWRVEESGLDRVLVSTDALAWQGDAAHQRLAWTYAWLTLAALAAAGLVLTVAARVGIRARLIDVADARLVSGVVMSVASAASAPIFLLRRDGELFFGGTSGLVPDTLGSLLAGTAYGVGHDRLQVPLALGVLSLSAAALAVTWLWSPRLRQESAVQMPAVTGAIVALVAVQAVMQHHVLGTPYPIARTALYLLPLLVLFVVSSADALATQGRPARIAATVFAALLASASAVHLARVANLTHTLDWPGDRFTPEMLWLVARTSPPARESPRTVRIGVDWLYYPVARYYAERQSTPATRYEAIVLPGDGLRFDFVYAGSMADDGSGTVIQRYPESGARLWHQPPTAP